MATLKQLEALVKVVELGSFDKAAIRLSTTQSAISKRIAELERSIGAPLLVRTTRTANLTEEGGKVLRMARDMLAIRERILEVAKTGPTAVRRLRLGVTELTAMTWLPRFVDRFGERYPRTRLELRVELSRRLFEALLGDNFDLIVIPSVFEHKDIASLSLPHVKNEWMANPKLLSGVKVIELSQLGGYPILTQSNESGTGVFFDNWLKSVDFPQDRQISTNSLVALVGLTVASAGISYLPVDCFRPLIESGRLAVVRTRPSPPAVPYAVLFRKGERSAFCAEVAELIRASCDFSTLYQG